MKAGPSLLYNFSFAVRSHEEIGRILLADLKAAKERLRIASEDFQNAFNALKNGPSGFEHPDRSFRLEQGGNAKQQALNDLRIAVQRHTDFVLRGIVPKDLQD